MSKLLTALRKLDAQSAARPARTTSERREALTPPPAAQGVPPDSLARITELNELLEEALSSQRTWLANELAVRTGFKKSLHVAPAPTPINVEPTPPALEPTPPPAAAEVVPLPIAREFLELAEKLASEIQIPAALSFTTADKASSSCHWLLPLATALSQSVDSRLLIMEAAEDEPRWASQLGIEPAKLLVDALATPAAWRDSIVPTAVPRIDLLPGGIGNLPASVDVRQSFRELLANLRAEYGLVLVAAGQAETPMTKILTSECSNAVLNLGLKRTGRAAAARAKRSLESTGVRLVGSVVCG